MAMSFSESLYFVAYDKLLRLFPNESEIYSMWMASRLHNWSYPDVTDFLKKNGFSFLKELGGSHQAWTKYEQDGQVDRRVEVNFTKSSYPIKTLKRMIYQSGIPAGEWIDWAGS